MPQVAFICHYLHTETHGGKKKRLFCVSVHDIQNSTSSQVHTWTAFDSSLQTCLISSVVLGCLSCLFPAGDLPFLAVLTFLVAEYGSLSLSVYLEFLSCWTKLGPVSCLPNDVSWEELNTLRTKTCHKIRFCFAVFCSYIIHSCIQLSRYFFMIVVDQI